MTDWSKLKVVDLRAELKSRGLQHQGLKQELVQRLSDDDVAQAIAPAPARSTSQEAPGTLATDEVSAPDDATPAEARPVPDSEALPQPVRNADDIAENDKNDDLAATDATDSLAISTSAQDATPEGASESNQDPQKRKRSSPSPLPSPSPKRLKAAEDGAVRSGLEVTGLPSTEKVDRQDEQQAAEPSLNGVADSAGSPSEMADKLDGDSGLRDATLVSSPSRAPEVSLAESQPTAQRPTPTPEVSGKPQNVDMASTDDYPTAVPDREESDEREQSRERHQSEDMENERAVEPALHLATRALYIKNFMRPLRAQEVQAHLNAVLTPLGRDVDGDAIELFYLDTIRTHAFAVFSNVSNAVRVRTALHDVTWPNESNRKQLWVDFVPPEKVQGWIDEEENTHRSGRGGSLARWEVRYERDHDGNIEAFLDSGSAPPAADRKPSRPHMAIPPVPPSAPPGPHNRFGDGANSIPLGPRGNRGTPQAPPSGPRSRPPSSAIGPTRTTRCDPPIQFQMVPEDLSRRRIDAIRSHYTRDTHRDLGREDEINRYTFEAGDAFVDRGKEVFIGIRPPHRENERQRQLAGRGPRPRHPPFSRGPPRRGPRDSRPTSDRYLPGINESGPFRQGDRGNFASRMDDTRMNGRRR